MSQNCFEIEILLATYNGALFLEEQLDSLFSQTCQDFSVIVRDDCSTDGTGSILSRYAAEYPQRFTYVINQERHGAAGNFATLLASSRAPYIMCCDQDDVWLPEKIALTLAAIRETERMRDLGTPVLVFTDAVLVDANLQVISPSLWRKCRIHPQQAQLRHLLAQNLVTGCTMGCNRALLERALPVPIPEAVMHDYWLAMVAAAFGALIPVHQQTILYRQHERNTIGVRRKLTPAQLLRRLFNDQELRAKLLAAVRQARAFSVRFAAELTRRQREELTAFQTLAQQCYVSRRWTILRNGLSRTGFWNNVGYLLRI